MNNGYGQELDRNGYAPSIVQDKCECYICHTQSGKIDRHEIFHGSLYRDKSKKFGLWIYLCHEHHMWLHNSPQPERKELVSRLQKKAQARAMDCYRWDLDMFRQRFGKNYI